MLDIRTIVVSNVLITVICALVIGSLWRQSRGRFAGIGYFLVDFAAQSLAAVLIALRGVIPDWMSIAVANTAVIGGAILGYVGLERYLGKRSAQHASVIAALTAGEGVRGREFQFSKRSKEMFTGGLSAEKLFIDGKPFVLASIEDISDRKQAEAELLHARKLEGIGQLAAGIAHEINTRYDDQVQAAAVTGIAEHWSPRV